MNPDDLLSSLRPLHLPSAISWWPPAPGWWLLALTTLTLMVFAVFWWRRGVTRRQALRELARLRSVMNDSEMLARLSILLRRYALVCFPPASVASLTGERWLSFLDEQGGGGQFLRGPGRALLEGPYQQSPFLDHFATQSGEKCRLDREALLKLVRRWIKRNRRLKK